MQIQEIAEKKEILKCAYCDVSLNPVRDPRVYDSDFDPRDIEGDEYCYSCWADNHGYCCICEMDVHRDDLCLHLFWNLDGEIAGPGAVCERDITDLGYVEKFIKPSVQKFFRELANHEINSDRWIATGRGRSQAIINLILGVCRMLEDDNLRVRTCGSIFGVDSVDFEAIDYEREGKRLETVYWIAWAGRLYDKRDLIHDGGSWMLCVGRPKTAFWNKETAKWAREIIPRIGRVHARYLRQKARKENL